MRDKINQLADGIFEYRESEIITMPAELKMEAESGSVVENVLTISDDKRHLLRGMVTVNSPYMSIETDTFRGVDNEITLSFDARLLESGKTVRGKIQVITDRGIKQVPFQVNITKKSQMQKEDKDIQDERMRLTLEREQIQFENCTDAFTEKLEITKDSQGYHEIQVSSDADFAVPEQERFSSDDFTKNKYILGIRLDPEKMAYGRNFARIHIDTVQQQLEVSVTAVKPGASHEEMLKNRRRQRALHQMMKRHIDFSMNRLPLEDYVGEMKKLLKNGGFDKEALRTRMYRLHLAILEHQTEQIKRELEDLEQQVEVLHRDAPVLYASYYYLKGLWSDEEAVTEDCRKRIRESYDKQGQHWQAIWFLLYMDPGLQAGRHKLAAITEQLEAGCNSPVMYLEACQVLNEAPKLLTELNSQMGEILHWGCKKEYLNRELALRYVYLVGKMKYTSSRIISDLEILYEQFEEEEILTTICKMLMKGQITTEDAFYWYAKGVEHNLKLTELYEYYMYSLDESREMKLNSAILLYFLYDNHLTLEKKAMLYAYIVRNRDEDKDTYESYRDTMQEFTMHQLHAGRINRNLAVLYEAFIKEDDVDKTLAADLSNVMFCHEIRCNNPNICGVYVKHPELQEEKYAALKQGAAVVTILTEQAEIYLADREGRRYKEAIDYSSEKLLHLDHLAETCLEYQKSDSKLLLFLYGQTEQNHWKDEMAMKLGKQVFQMEEISREFRSAVFYRMLQYYQKQESDFLDELLDSLDMEILSPAGRVLFIKYCAGREKYDKAMEGILTYGYEQINAKELLRISEGAFHKTGEAEDPKMVKLAWYMFWEGVYSPDTLQYLCRFYNGTVEDMVQIWEEAVREDLDILDFEERLLGQAVFSGEILPEVFDVFYYYQEKGSNKQLLTAFKKLMAYEYLVKDRQIPVELFGYYFRDVQIQENLPCLIAILKYFSTCKTLSEEEVNFADYHLMKLYDQKIVFPFYQDFYGKFPLPIHIMDERYIQHITDPSYEVTIHYRILSAEKKNEKYKVEKMRDVFEGIRVKEFVLFQDETLEYYITEHRPGETIRSAVNRVVMDESMDYAGTGSRYHNLNLMMIAQEMKDDAALVDLMEEYAMEREMTKEIFQPL